MSGKEQKKKKKKASEVLSWQQKKELADKDEEALRKEVDEISSWSQANMIRTMGESQLKECVLSMPKNLQSGKTVKGALGKKPRRSVKPRASSSSSLGIIASVWKFHKDDDEEPSSLEVPG